jgi:tRNA nucleotidyltransferase/poly(A) polymerase
MTQFAFDFAAAEERLRARLGVLSAPDGPLGFLSALADEWPAAEWFLVGGTVRDTLLGRQVRADYDLVVRGVTLRQVAERLGSSGKVDFVGRTFGVLKYAPHGQSGGAAIDIAWPRTERAGMSGAYRDFTVMADPDLPIERDLARRDFTVNALAWDMRRGRLVDEHGGLADLARRELRAVGAAAERFAEDRSRVLRGLRFACELGFSVEAETWAALAAMAPRLTDTLPDGEPVVPAETAAKELLRALVAAPAKALRLFDASGALSALAPEFTPLKGCPQSPDYHSEGDVWKHTLRALEALGSERFAARFPGETPSPRAIVATLCHDLGKPSTRRERDGRWTFHGHDEAGARITEALAERLRWSSVGALGVDREGLVTLVRRHMFVHLVDLEGVRRTTLAKYFLDDPALGRDQLHVGFADAAASLRPDGQPDFTALDGLLRELETLRARPAAPLLAGEAVMRAFELAPGPEVGRLLAAVREAQLAGEVTTADEAREFLRGKLGMGRRAAADEAA